MGEIVSLILSGCKLAKELEANLPNIKNRPDMISRSCDEIIKRFLAARERLNAHHQAAPATLFNYPAAAAGEIVFHEQQVLHVQQQQQIDANLQEWLRSSVTQAMDIIQTQVLGADQRNPYDHISEREMEGTSTTRLRSKGGDHHHVQTLDISDSSRGSSSSKRRYRRRENTRIVRESALQIGNAEIPPEDGFTWRKYGQKEIMNSNYPRSYYRCTHHKLYQCPAKRQVQRLDDDPYTFEILYRGHHTCHLSLTAPLSSVPPPPSPSSAAEMITQEMTQSFSVTMQHPSSTSTIGRWLTMDVGGGSGGAGPSTIRYEREAAGAGDQYFVANMADAMFNSVTSSSSIDFLFPSSILEDKKDNEA